MNYESKADCSANSYIIEISSFKLPASLALKRLPYWTSA